MKKEGMEVKKKGYVGSWDTEMRQVPQDIAEYKPFGASENRGCANCQWFVSPDSCVLVNGDINPGGLSKFYTERVKYPTPVLDVNVVGWGVESKETPKPSLLSRLIKSTKTLLGLEPQPTPFMVYKAADNSLRFLVTYTNCFVDRTKEILSSDSHQRYVEWVDQSKLYPQLQLWHCGELSAIGQVDWVEFADGFGQASGIIAKEYEEIATNLANSDDTGVSHGFIGLKQIGDSGVYSDYATFEISLLPRSAAANVWLDTLVTSKEYDVGFSEDKKAWLIKTGIPAADVIAWENNSKSLGETLRGMNVAYRSADEPAEVAAAETTPVSASSGGGEVGAVSTPSIDGLGIITKALADQSNALTGLVNVVKGLVEGQKTLGARVDAVAKPIEQQVEQHFAAASSPAAALATAHIASQSTETVTKEAPTLVDDFSWFDKEALPFFQKAG